MQPARDVARAGQSAPRSGEVAESGENVVTVVRADRMWRDHPPDRPRQRPVSAPHHAPMVGRCQHSPLRRTRTSVPWAMRSADAPAAATARVVVVHHQHRHQRRQQPVHGRASSRSIIASTSWYTSILQAASVYVRPGPPLVFLLPLALRDPAPRCVPQGVVRRSSSPSHRRTGRRCGRPGLRYSAFGPLIGKRSGAPPAVRTQRVQRGVYRLVVLVAGLGKRTSPSSQPLRASATVSM